MTGMSPDLRFRCDLRAGADERNLTWKPFDMMDPRMPTWPLEVAAYLYRLSLPRSRCQGRWRTVGNGARNEKQRPWGAPSVAPPGRSGGSTRRACRWSSPPGGADAGHGTDRQLSTHRQSIFYPILHSATRTTSYPSPLGYYLLSQIKPDQTTDGTMSSAPTLPPISSLPSLPQEAQFRVLDTLFEPSPELHTLMAPVLANQTFSSYAALIDAVGGRMAALHAANSPRDKEVLEGILGSHPRLGESSLAAKEKMSELSRAEQANLNAGGEDVEAEREKEQLRALNREYEERFPGLRYVYVQHLPGKLNLLIFLYFFPRS